jgi:hypothetical protein
MFQNPKTTKPSFSNNNKSPEDSDEAKRAKVEIFYRFFYINIDIIWVRYIVSSKLPHFRSKLKNLPPFKTFKQSLWKIV